MNIQEQTYGLRDPATGIRELPNALEEKSRLNLNKPVRLLFFTDPICSSCWGIEPQLRKLQAEYGHYFEIEYRMGGLLKSWEEYGGSDVRRPRDVARHWDEASVQYDMPIDGDIWNEDPLDSSYPPSIAFKAAQLQDKVKAVRFLRRIKEMVFVEKKNITHWENLVQAALETGLEMVQFREDFTNKAATNFEEDLLLAKQLGVRGFPTIFFMDAEGNHFKVYGSQPYASYEQALLKLLPEAKKKAVPASYEAVLEEYDTVTTKEFAMLNNRNKKEAEVILNYLVSLGEVKKIRSKNGNLWKRVANGDRP